MRIASIALLILLVSSISCAGQSVSAPESLQLTVYNANFALVKDTRSVTLRTGVNSIEVEDVAAKIDPTSVLFKSITAPNEIAILEQNYQYDLINPENILSKSVGKRATFTRFDADGNAHTSSGVILNPGPSHQLVIESDDGQVVLRPAGQVSLESMPAGLHPKPTLNWLLASDVSGRQKAEISYITDGIGWKADYVVLVNDDDTALDLAGWVTLNNQSGATYDDARLTLMAGDVRRLQPQREAIYLGAEVRTARAPAAPQFEEKAFFEYHIYTMARPTTIRDRETKQLSLLNASDVPVKKEMIYDGRGNWWRRWWHPGRTGDPGGGYDTSDYHKVNVVLEVTNSRENHMGMPLPKGKVRVYKLDDEGSQQFIGEDEIDHTPRDEKIRLYIGDAFDVVGDYRRTDYKKISRRVIEESFQVDIRNHKDTEVEVLVMEHVWDDWKVLRSSHGYNKIDAHTIRFPVTVPADGEVKITYTIRTRW